MRGWLCACFSLLTLCLATPGWGATVSHADFDATNLAAIWAEFLENLTLQDYNVRVVTLGVAVLGLACGVVGPLLLLRKRALMGDVISHAATPGVYGFFLIGFFLGVEGKSLPVMVAGAAVASLLGVGAVMLIKSQTRLKEDAAMGIVLSVFYGLGVFILSSMQNLGGADRSGLESFILGKAAAMIASDAYFIGVVAAVIVVVVIVLLKEFRLLCFDQNFASSQGWSILTLDILLMGLVVSVTVIGLQAVGAILMVAMLIIPAAAARFWTHQLSKMVVVSGVIGALSGWLGAMISATIPKAPAGAVIVLVCGLCFGLSFLFGTAGGVVKRLYLHVQFGRRTAEQNLLRALHESLEQSGELETPDDNTQRKVGGVSVANLMLLRSWTSRQLRRAIGAARRKGLVFTRQSANEVCLSSAGRIEAARVVRNHRLWEAYLVMYADIAPGQVDHEADRIEHVLDAELVKELELRVLGESSLAGMPNRI